MPMTATIVADSAATGFIDCIDKKQVARNVITVTKEIKMIILLIVKFLLLNFLTS